MRYRLGLFVILGCLMGLIILQNVNAVSVSEGDSFTIEMHTHLSGISYDYTGYSEDEYETRMYNVSYVGDDQVDWEMSRDYSFTSNEGGDFSEDTEHTFSINTTDGSYLGDTHDSPSSYLKYYTFDNIWFQIDPDLPEGSTVHILGHDYTVIGQTTIFLDLIRAVNVIEVSIIGAHQTVSDPEYDPYDDFDMVFDETYYFDPVTGYVVMYVWSANCDTQIGAFDWHERGYTTTASFELQANLAVSLTRMVTYLICIIGIMGLGVVVNHVAKRSWRDQVDKALDIISGKEKTPEPKQGEVAPSVWNPLSIDYRQLLENPPEINRVTLISGVFIVIEPDGRIAVVDTKGKHDLGNLVFTSKEESIWLLYRLALGAMAYDSAEYNLCMGTFPELQSYIEPTPHVAALDSHAEEVFYNLTTHKEDGYAEISQLMAHRKVLDYSLGQAPLAPESHLKKLKRVIQHNPTSVLLVGDDDLLSVSLAKRGVAVTLVEIDPYTCALIQSLASKDNLPITIYQTDLRAPLPMELPSEFDLFVADPDFTIESLALFLSRGLSQIRRGGTGLINFQNTRSQRYKIHYMLKKLDVDVHEQIKEKWTYTIVRNKVAYVTGVGKYSHVNYRTEVALSTAPYSSVMFEISRTPDTRIVLPAEGGLIGPDYAIYDF